MNKSDAGFSLDYEAAIYFLRCGQYLFENIQDQGQRSVKFLSATDVQKAFICADEDSGWIPDGLERFGRNKRGPWYIYQKPPQIVTIEIKTGETVTLTIPIPGTMLAAVNQNYYLFAFTGEFSKNTALCHAPFPNVGPDGHICFGQNEPPKINPQNPDRAWRLFFRSPFNRDLADGKCKKHKNNVLFLLEELNGKKKFPAGQLIEQGLTPEQWIRREVQQ